MIRSQEICQNLLKIQNGRRVRFDFKPKNKAVTIRMSEELLNELKKRAEKLGLGLPKIHSHEA
jgi:predicted DNA binding CopG/RHH family protein